MITCPECKKAMLGNPTFCLHCGKPLEMQQLERRMKTIEAEETVVIQSSELRGIPKPQRTWTSAEVGQTPVVELHIDGKICPVQLTPNGLVLVGRDDCEGHAGADVDLTPYDGYEKGVSRIHAALVLEDGMLKVKDMESTNGTFVNRQQVTNGQWRVVRDQDELRLGTLVLKVHFRHMN